MKIQDLHLDRREFVKTYLGGAGSLYAAGLFGLSCRDRPDGSAAEAGGPDARAPSTPPSSTTVREFKRVVAEGQVEVASGRTYESWFYDAGFPGPEIRVREGEWLRVVVENQLPEATTIHWHGLPVPNSMDGVPDVTQDPIPPGGQFVYEFPATPAGTYLYHSHVGLQLDRGLVGPLIVEERDPHVSWDREHVLVLDDFLPGEPEPLDSGGMMGSGGMMRGMMGRQGPDLPTPPYLGALINGRLADAAPTFEVRSGERVRLRLLNPSGATTFRFAVAGHPLTVTHADGRPVRPIEVDSLTLGMGERYDVIVQADRPGAWAMVAQPVKEVDVPAGRAVLRYREARARRDPSGEIPEGIEGGRQLRLADLQAIESLPGTRREPDRIFDLPLSGGMMGGRWTIGGQSFPDAEPLEISEGELIRVRMVNHSMMLHPMHLHGHYFRVGEAIKDTVIVPAHMGDVSFEFVADNPGNWFFHCHNIYHLEDGMARVFRYRS